MDGVRFTCQPGCTRCCDQKGFVYLTEDNLRAAARYQGMSAAAFERKYVYRTRYTLRFRKPRDRQCPFLQSGGCSIHPVKPDQCRLFPFWPELVESGKAWSETAGWCPGIGVGPLIQIGTALETASEMKHSYPGQYPPVDLAPR
jgi:Fe-S-cluster containining protein